ncbi:MAG: formate--tetrahydrofolate ligase [Christensenellales bacterium]
MKTDIEIARETPVRPIKFVAEKLGLSENEYDCYGKFKAKIKIKPRRNDAKLILVTAMNPTPFGEGKTTVSIGLADALSLSGKKTCLALREPSLGPVFGIKGGACGGGYSQIVPMEDINLHFTGDFHAVTYANDLLSALIDNHIMQGNELDIRKVVWKRCLDLNDRALRVVDVALGEKNGVPREDGFTITAASEIMAILCLSDNLSDLKRRLGNVLIGYNGKGEAVYAKDLGAEESMAILLKDAVSPNLVQTLEGTPAIVHGGPFANIAHGCNTVAATKVAMSLADYVVTEAGFGAELGAEKFFDIKCRKTGLSPDATVLVVTLRSIKYNAGVPSDKISLPDNEAIIKGFGNVKRHIGNLKNVFNQNVVVALNRFPADGDEEIALLKNLCQTEGATFAVSEGFSKGGEGCLELAKQVLLACEHKTELRTAYPDSFTVKEKIEAVAYRVYGAKSVTYSDKAEAVIASLDERTAGFPVCIAKTQYSFSGDPALLGAPEGFNLDVKEIHIRSGAEFLVVQCGSILLMPGLSKVPCAMKMKISDDGVIDGLM